MVALGLKENLYLLMTSFSVSLRLNQAPSVYLNKKKIICSPFTTKKLFELLKIKIHFYKNKL